MGVSDYKMYYGLLESKLFIILIKYISLERSESQDSNFFFFFFDRQCLERNVYICDRKNASKEFGWHPVAICGIIPRQNCIGTSIYLCMYVCMYVCIYFYLFIYLFIFIISACMYACMYRCISINYNVVEKFIYFSNSTQIVKLVY